MFRRANTLTLHILPCVVFLLLVSPALAENAVPLADIHTGDGQAAKIETTKSGFLVNNASEIVARVVAAPDAFLCRVAPGSNRDVVQLSIGRVESLRCDSLFSPSRDEAITFEANRVEIRWQTDHYQLSAQGPLTVRRQPNFMKSRPGLEWFRPLDKTVFSRAPAGWCSWYIYYQDVREDHVTRNTDWLAANLKKFGCEYVQIDEGWQGVGKGNGENRDWYVTEPHKFPHGMKWLADYIRGKGLTPGIWVIPFTTSDEKFFHQHPEMFLHHADGTSIFETRDPKTGKVEFNWAGRYAIDATTPQGRKWIADLLHMLCRDWGYDYVKIDGQGDWRNVCNSRDRAADPKPSPQEAYRLGLAAAKSQMKPNQFLLNCGGTPSSCGYCQGMRTGADVGAASWDGIQTAMRSTMSCLLMNNICFWDDPDVVCVRPPLSYQQAQVWATLVGITGQLLMTSDDMPALKEDRVELVRRLFPVADIRPMELYGLCGWPRIFDLRVASPGAGQWDVVALFNWDTLKNATIRLEPKDLGWREGNKVYYDAWEKRLLGVGSDGLTLVLPPTSCRLVAVRPQADWPQLVGTSRHITQGADDLLEAKWDSATSTWSGRSRVVGGDPYELRFTLPPGWSCPDARVSSQGHLALLTLRSKESKTIPWRIAFSEAGGAEDSRSIGIANAVREGATVSLKWKGEGAIAYRVYCNGKLLGQTTDTSFSDRVDAAGPGLHRYSVSALGWDVEGQQEPAGEINIVPPPRGKAKDAWLDELKPMSQLQDIGVPQPNHSIEGNPLRIAGKTYAHGVGAHATSRILYQLDNRYRQFEAEVGVDDEKGGQGTVVFQVFCDGRKVFDSGLMRGKQPAKKVSLPLDGVEELLLVVTDAGDGINCDHADWCNARLLGNK